MICDNDDYLSKIILKNKRSLLNLWLLLAAALDPNHYCCSPAVQNMDQVFSSFHIFSHY